MIFAKQSIGHGYARQRREDPRLRALIHGALDGRVSTLPVPIPRDFSDWMLGAMWAHPERVLDENARASTSGFARMRPDIVERVVRDVRRDLADGSWTAGTAACWRSQSTTPGCDSSSGCHSSKRRGQWG